MSEDEEAVRAVIEEYGRRFGDGDVAGVLDLFEPDGTIVQPNGVPLEGTDRIAQALHFAFGGATIEVQYDFDDVLVDNDLAAARTHSTGDITMRASGEVTPGAWQEMWVLRRRAGEWRIADYMFLKVPAFAQT